MESQESVSTANQVKLFFVTLGTTLVAIAAPIGLTIAFHRSVAVGSVLSIILASAIALGVRKVIKLSRAPGARLFERSSRALLTVCLTGGLILAMTGATVATIDQHAHRHFVTTVESDGASSTSEYDTYTPSEWGWVGLGLVLTALILVFGALAFIPSTERELRRRIDLEATSIAMGVCLLFFLVYNGITFVVRELPKFSNLVAISSMVIAYLLARIVLSIRYR